MDLGFTIYDGKSTDVILSLPVPPSTGYFSQVQNAAELTNKGMEISANWRAITTPAVVWTIGAQYARNRNKVTDLRGAEEFFLGGTFNGGIKRGYAHGVFIDWDFARCRYDLGDDNLVGGFDVNAFCLANDAPDGAMYIGDDGFPVFDETPHVVGDPNPDWTGNLSSSLNLWGKLNISALVDYRSGGQVFNGTKGALLAFGAHKTSEMRGEQRTFGVDWLPGPTTGPGAGTAVVLDEDTWFGAGLGNWFNGPGSQFIEDGTFLKLREVSVSYNLTAPFVQRAGFSSVDIRLAGRNLWMQTDYTGIDPESNLGGATSSRGNEYFNNPQSRSLVVSFAFNR